MIMPLTHRLLAYRIPALLLTTAISLIALIRGLSISSILSESSWPPPLREQAVVLAEISAGLAVLIVLLVRWRLKNVLAALAIAAVIVLMAAVGFAGVLGAAAVAGCCFAIGHMLVVTLGGRRHLEALDTGIVGLAALMLLLGLIGALRIYMIPLLWLVVLGCAFGYAASKSLRARMGAGWTRFRALSCTGSDLPWLASVPLALGIFAVAFYAAQTAIPERYSDALVMHLLVPSQIQTFGRWNFDPREIAFALMPVTVDYVYTLASVLGGEMAARMFNLLVLFAILGQIAAMVIPMYGGQAAGLAVLLFLSIPIALVVTASLFIENTVALLSITAVRLVLQQNGEQFRSALIGLALTLGALCASKLHGVLVSLPIDVFALGNQDYRRLSRNDWRVIGTICVVAMLLGATPYILAWIKSGNPVFPLYNALFKSPYWPPTNFIDERWIGHNSPLLLYRMTFDTPKYFESYNGSMGFVFVSLLLPGLIAALARPRRDIMLCVVVSAFALAVLTGQSQYVRYLYPIFPLLVVICIAAVSQLATVRPWRLPILALTTVVAGIGIYKLPSAAWFIQQTTLSAAFNSDQKTALLRAQVPVRLANTVINDMMARPRVIYALPTTYGAFLAGTPIYVAWYNSILTDGLGAATTTEAVKQIMDRQRADFIITEAFPIDFYMASRLAKVRAYAEANADLVTTIASVKIYKTRPR